MPTGYWWKVVAVSTLGWFGQEHSLPHVDIHVLQLLEGTGNGIASRSVSGEDDSIESTRSKTRTRQEMQPGRGTTVTRISAMAVAFLLVLVACGGAAGTPAEAGGAANESGAAPAAGESTADGDSTSSETEGEGDEQDPSDPWASYVSPIGALLGFDGRDDEAQQAEFEQQEREAQDEIRRCMAAEGFEYQPLDRTDTVFFGEVDELSPEERTLQYGYGMSTYFDEEQTFEGEEAFQDPNQDYVDSLGEAEQDAYYRALYGDSPEIDESLTEEEIEALFDDYQPTGCEPTAYDAIYGGGDEVGGFYETFGEQLEAMYERIQADPRIVAERDAWVACMAEAGYAFSSQDEVYQELERRMQPVWESQSFPGEELSEEEFEALSEDELEALFSQRPEVDEALLAEVREYELAVAAADLSCPGTSFLPSEAFFEVIAQYEQAFIDENADQIRELLPDAEF